MYASSFFREGPYLLMMVLASLGGIPYFLANADASYGSSPAVGFAPVLVLDLLSAMKSAPVESS
jgi:hypothetical protein